RLNATSNEHRQSNDVERKPSKGVVEDGDKRRRLDSTTFATSFNRRLRLDVSFRRLLLTTSDPAEIAEQVRVLVRYRFGDNPALMEGWAALLTEGEAARRGGWMITEPSRLAALRTTSAAPCRFGKRASLARLV